MVAGTRFVGPRRASHDGVPWGLRRLAPLPSGNARRQLFVSAQKVWDDWERGQLARWVWAGKLPALPVLLRANNFSRALPATAVAWQITGRLRSGLGRLVLPSIALYSWVERRRAVYYLDTSALVKRYVHEQSSIWIDTLVGPFKTITSTW